MDHVSEGGAGPRAEFQIKKRRMSVMGNLAAEREQEQTRFFRRKVKAFGKVLSPAKSIPWRGTTPMESDKGSGVRESPKDKVM